MPSEKLGPEKLAAKMREIRENYGGDPEACHGDADGLLTRELRALGYEDAMILYDGMEKWYA